MRVHVLLLVTFLLGLVPTGSALAQRDRRRTSQVRMAQAQHRVEINAFGGYGLTFSRRVCAGFECGDVDIEDQGFWGVELDVNVQPYTQLALLYDRQESTVSFRPDVGTKRDGVDVITEYWHIGGLRGVQQGSVMPFGSVTLGATRYNFKTALIDDEWKFSIMLGAGAKIYASERVGLRIQGRLPFTFTSGSFGVGCGAGGCGAMIGGTGIARLDFSGGVMVML